MKIKENNDILSSMFDSKVKKSSNFKFETFHTNFVILYKEKNSNCLIEEIDDNKYKDDYDKSSFRKEYISYCEEENEINETNLN